MSETITGTGDHRCHNPDCRRSCPPRFLMCRACWRRVPRDLQRRVWATYQAGQERGLVWPSADWHEAADAAIKSVCPTYKGLSARMLDIIRRREERQ